MKNFIYLFCLARPSLLPDEEEIGVNGHSPIFLQSFQDIAAVLSKISFEEFRGQAAEAKMQDLAWLGPRVCRHAEVVEQVMRYSPVLPVRFGTIFSSRKSLEAILNKQYRNISRFLDKTADKEEWLIKGFLNRAKAEEELLPTLMAREEGRLAASSPKMRCFQELRIRSSVGKELNCRLKEVFKRIRNDLSRFASNFCAKKALPSDATGTNMDIVLNWAFLLPLCSRGNFHARIDQVNAEHAHQGLVFQMSGPWPPYSFRPSLMME